jgi:hypothetical protein
MAIGSIAGSTAASFGTLTTPETLVGTRPFRGAMPSYRIPNDARVRESLNRIFSTRPMVESQRRLKALVEKDLKGEEKYRVGEPRLRVLAIESGLVSLEIRCRDTPEMRSLVKCPVCGERLKKVRNMTVYGGTVTLGYRCERCKYWTGLKRRVPTRYVFTRRS